MGNGGVPASEAISPVSGELQMCSACSPRPVRIHCQRSRGSRYVPVRLATYCWRRLRIAPGCRQLLGRCVIERRDEHADERAAYVVSVAALVRVHAAGRTVELERCLFASVIRNSAFLARDHAERSGLYERLPGARLYAI